MKAADSAIPDSDPFALFEVWFAEARESEPNDPNAMALATATPDGHPSVRMVLLKGHGAAVGAGGGFVFYTNAESRKGEEIRANHARRAAVPLEEPAAADPHRRPARGSERGRGRRLFPFARARRRRSVRRPPTSRVRWPTAGSISIASPRSSSAIPRATSRARRTGPASACSPRRIEFWLRSRIPPPRPAAVHPRRGGRGVVEHAALSVNASRPPAGPFGCARLDLGGGGAGAAQDLGQLAHRIDRDARQPRRFGARPGRQPRDADRRVDRLACRPTRTTGSAMARPRRWQRSSR